LKVIFDKLANQELVDAAYRYVMSLWI